LKGASKGDGGGTDEIPAAADDPPSMVAEAQRPDTDGEEKQEARWSQYTPTRHSFSLSNRRRSHSSCRESRHARFLLSHLPAVIIPMVLQRMGSMVLQKMRLQEA